jgi:dTDP-4-dehydrorhamnose 3,5-epimerase
LNIKQLSVSDVLIIEPDVFLDDRGFFFESYNKLNFEYAVGREVQFVQDNHTKSSKGVLRGLHYQTQRPQGKLVRVTHGKVFDVVVDLRKNSPSYGKSVSNVLSAENRQQLWVPEGMAHGFLVLSEIAELLYKTTDYYAPEFEQCIAWDDPTLGIEWPLDAAPKLSPKDQQGLPFSSLK